MAQGTRCSRSRGRCCDRHLEDDVQVQSWEVAPNALSGHLFVSSHRRRQGFRLVGGGSGKCLYEEPMSGVRSVMLDCRVVPECPPGPAACRSFWSSIMRAWTTLDSRRLRAHPGDCGGWRAAADPAELTRPDWPAAPGPDCQLFQSRQNRVVASGGGQYRCVDRGLRPTAVAVGRTWFGDPGTGCPGAASYTASVTSGRRPRTIVTALAGPSALCRLDGTALGWR
jgi:hypothetical protein